MSAPGRALPVFATVLRIAALLTTVSLAALVLRLLGRPAWLPVPVKHALDAWLEPGLAVWWVTLGGPFQHAPTALGGYAVTLAGNVAFWGCAAWLCARLYFALRRRT